MRSASARAVSAVPLERLPLPSHSAAQLRLALEALPAAPDGVPDPIPRRACPEPLRAVHLPRLAWPDRPQRARMADGTAAARRDDFYDWILLRRRRAQIVARRAIA